MRKKRRSVRQQHVQQSWRFFLSLDERDSERAIPTFSISSSSITVLPNLGAPQSGLWIHTCHSPRCIPPRSGSDPEGPHRSAGRASGRTPAPELPFSTPKGPILNTGDPEIFNWVIQLASFPAP
jgi:hypothetical protein